MTLPESTSTRMPSGMDNEVETEENWERFQESVGFKTRNRTSSEPEGVAGSFEMTSSTPLQFQSPALSNSVGSFFLRTCLANVFLFLFFHSISSSSPFLGLSWTNTNSGNRPQPSLIVPYHDLEV